MAQKRLLTFDQRRHWLRLIRSENVGPIGFRTLINRFGSAQKALEALPELARSGGKSNIRIPPMGEIDGELESIERKNAHLVAIGERGYPSLLARIDNPPPLLTIKGTIDIAPNPTIAIVGSRNASLVGQKFAEALARKLGSEGCVISSGLARGIDAAAHRGALSTGTIAVLAGGLDKPYPQENKNLYDQIGEQGLLVTEMPMGWSPRAQDFPRRNRIVAGMSYGLVIVEAALRSGSLISARLANDMGRLVFAVPGSPVDPRSVGTNKLLKDGAILLTEAEDVLAALAPILGDALYASQPSTAKEDPVDFATIAHPEPNDRTAVIEILGLTPLSIDEIIRHTGLHPAQVALVLLELELAGRLERHTGNAVSLMPEVLMQA